MNKNECDIRIPRRKKTEKMIQKRLSNACKKIKISILEVFWPIPETDYGQGRDRK